MHPIQTGNSDDKVDTKSFRTKTRDNKIFKNNVITKFRYMESKETR